MTLRALCLTAMAFLAMAGAARPQVSPLVAVMAMWLAARVGIRRALLPSAIIAAAAITVMLMNLSWFGHALGATPALYSSQETSAHATSSTIAAKTKPPTILGFARRLMLPFSG